MSSVNFGFVNFAVKPERSESLNTKKNKQIMIKVRAQRRRAKKINLMQLLKNL